MPKGKKTCNECGVDFDLHKKNCPECGTEYKSEFVFMDDDIVVNQEKGHEIAISPETHHGWRLRMAGRPTCYLPSMKMIYKEVFDSNLRMSAKNTTALEGLVEIERQALKFIETISEFSTEKIKTMLGKVNEEPSEVAV